jgi:hypothetical protein
MRAIRDASPSSSTRDELVSKQKQIKVWIGFTDGKPNFYAFSDYYRGVLHGDMFKSKRAAKQCYEDVRPCVLTIFEK